MASALDLRFMPTNAIIGSGAADENKDTFTVIDDPFGSGKKLGAVKSLNPDVSLIHGWVSDCQGNTIIAPSRFSGQGVWGAKAAKNVAVSVEQIVPADFIRENCGWNLKVWPKVKEISAPSLDELLILRLLDPRALCTSA